MRNPNMAILMVGFDGYCDLWNDFFNLMQIYWKDNPYKIYLVNNVLKCNYKNVEIINAGIDSEWSKKVQIALDSIDEKYICLMLEDFFIGKCVNTLQINDAINFMENEKIKYYKLNSFSKINTNCYKGIKYLHTIPSNLDYGISLQPAIWEKEYLKSILGNGNYNAWVFEFDRIRESRGRCSEPLNGCVYDERNILNIKHGVVQGKFLPNVVNYFNKIGYKLNTSKREIMSYNEYLIYKSKGFIKNILPQQLTNILKKILHTCGYSFVSDKYAATK